jgi:hypothetical protein
MKYFLIVGYYYPLFGDSLLYHAQLSHCDMREEAESFFKESHPEMFDVGLSRDGEYVLFDLSEQVEKVLRDSYRYSALTVLVLYDTTSKVVTSIIPIVMSGDNKNSFIARALTMQSIKKELSPNIECRVLQIVLHEKFGDTPVFIYEGLNE